LFQTTAYSGGNPFHISNMAWEDSRAENKEASGYPFKYYNVFEILLKEQIISH